MSTILNNEILFGAEFNLKVFRLQTLFRLLMLEFAADMFKWTQLFVVVVVALSYVWVMDICVFGFKWVSK